MMMHVLYIITRLNESSVVKD